MIRHLTALAMMTACCGAAFMGCNDSQTGDSQPDDAQTEMASQLQVTFGDSHADAKLNLAGDIKATLSSSAGEWLATFSFRAEDQTWWLSYGDSQPTRMEADFDATLEAAATNVHELYDTDALALRGDQAYACGQCFTHGYAGVWNTACCNGCYAGCTYRFCKPCAGGGCFAAGTTVAMSDGTQRAIENVKVGEAVMSFDEKTGRIRTSTVVKTFAHPSEEGEVLVNGTLHATPNHPFYVNGRWMRADEINVGDSLLRLSELANAVGSKPEALGVSSLQALETTQTVYNLEVEDTHTYFAGGLLVHNK